jgi:hypothetical protein
MERSPDPETLGGFTFLKVRCREFFHVNSGLFRSPHLGSLLDHIDLHLEVPSLLVEGWVEEWVEERVVEKREMSFEAVCAGVIRARGVGAA